MYAQAWRKYLPVIVILIKRSSGSAQTLAMDADDFIKSSGGKKLKLGFTGLNMNHGRVSSVPAQPEVAKDLAALLHESQATKSLLQTRNIHFSMTNDCFLSISNEVPVTAES
ncbi:MAG: hypothetical protein JO301_11415 [Chitinophagaceae bacterium]|nr:hypothetical protein [Chitinophagaceae bacterium]